MLLTALTVLLTSLLSALFLTAAARLSAPRFGFLDRPDKVRKLHCRPTPLGGGSAVFLGVVVGLAVLVTTPSGSASVLGGHWPFLLTMIISGGTITTVGLVDDLRDLPVRWKLLGQLAASLILVAGGVLIDRVELFGGQFYLGLLAAPLTLFWVLGAINSVNLLDGIDGFATVQGILMLSAVAAIAGGVQPHVTLVAVALLGGLLGFLAHNLPPARIFLGDAGSMLIGLMARCPNPRGMACVAAFGGWQNSSGEIRPSYQPGSELCVLESPVSTTLSWESAAKPSRTISPISRLRFAMSLARSG